MKKIILLIATVWTMLTVSAQVDSAGWYNNGILKYWKLQPDMFAFSYTGTPSGITGPLNWSIIDTLVLPDNQFSDIIQIFYKPSATPSQIQTQKNQIQSNPQFERALPAITKEPTQAFDREKWKQTDNLLLVVFQDPNISYTDIQDFASRNCLDIVLIPDANLPSNHSWTHAFALAPNQEVCAFQNTADAAKQIWEAESAILKHIEPNMQLKAPQLKPQAAGGAGSAAFCNVITNEPTPNRMWHIDNDGSYTWGANTATNDADCDICECWQAGYNGWNIKVAVIDFHGFEFTHEDMGGRYLNGVNLLDSTVISGTTIIDNTQAHGQLVSSTIAAVDNNGVGIAGVARHSKVIPLLTDGNFNQIIFGIQQAVLLDADVINMSFSSTFDYGPLHNEIIGADTTGRPDQWVPSIKYGIVCVGSAGNDDNSTVQYYPAAYPEVLGVGASTPNDFKGIDGDGWGSWGPGGGSNYGPFYEVVAPGAVITGHDFMGANGWLSGNYVNINGTSLSAPITSGIAAILLSKNGGLFSKEVRDTIIASAEKVNPGTYDYNYDPLDPGRAFEMQYGRVNCFDALNSVSVGIDDISYNLFNDDIQLIAYNGQLTILYDLKDKNNDLSIQIYDMLGRKLITETLPASRNDYTFSIAHLANAPYIIGFYTKQGNRAKSAKFVKQ